MRLKIVTGLLLALLSTRAVAIDLLYLPKWHMQGDMACYTFEETKGLVKMDLALKSCEQDKADYAEAMKAVTLLNETLTLRTNQVNLAMEESTKLKTSLDACIDAKAAAEVKAASGPSFGWLVAGGALLLTAGIIVGAFFIK